MTKLENLIECYPHEIAALENNLKRFPKDSARKKLLKHLQVKLFLAREAKSSGLEDWPLREISVLRIKLKAERDLKYHSIQNRS